MYKRLKKYLPQPQLFLITILLILLGIFLVSRIGMVLYNTTNYKISSYSQLFKAFYLGIWYDTIVACWMLALPYFVMTFLEYKGIEHKKYDAIVRIYCVIMIVIALLAIGIDMPYFKFFNSRLNVAAVPRIENLFFALSFLSKEPQYYPFAIILILATWLLYKAINKIWIKTKEVSLAGLPKRRKNFAFLGTSAFIFIMLFFRTSEVNMATAYFSNDPFVNQIVLNPIYTYTDSYYHDFQIEENIPDSSALKIINTYFKLPKKQIFTSPLARKVTYPSSEKPNVVVILMESMSAEKMGWFLKSDSSLTPFLDNLTKKSIFFPNFYSWGIHTYNGIFSTLYGMPYNMLEHPMKYSEQKDNYYGLAGIFRDNGYSTTFCCTHDKEFDNIGKFIPNNGYQNLYDVKSYPVEKWVNDWGVGDETLLEFGLNKMDSLHKNKKPFFISILTNSNHPPFTFPNFTKCKRITSKDARDRGFQYADWALEEFFKAAEKKSWFKNTIFVLVGDHGVNTPSPWEVTMTYNHVPCYIYAPKKIEPKTIQSIGSQIDILPTLLHLTQTSYTRNTLGYNLLKEKRPFVVFSQDHKVAVLNQDHILIHRKGGTTSLYKNTSINRDTTNYFVQQKALSDSMQNFAAATLKTTKIMLLNNWMQKPKLILVTQDAVNKK